jgi:NAD(P)-dependent dehydrogenase (short-subunit alcohol dehydrogenase family)
MKENIYSILTSSVIVLGSLTIDSLFAQENIFATKSSQQLFTQNGKKDYHMFKDNVVLITGGTSGIGLATAVKFASSDSAHIIVCGRNKSKWEEAQTYIKNNLTAEQAKKIEYWPCDVRVESQVKEMIERVFIKYGRLDVCFNNAGVQPGDVTVGGDITKLEFESMIGEDGSILFRLPPPQPTSRCLKDNSCPSIIPSQYTTVSPYVESPFATSIFGIFYSLKWEINYIFEKQPKHLPVAIINTSSRNGVIPDPHRPVYAGSKAFILSITHSLSNQVAQRAVKEGREVVRINAISPGPVDTPLERAAFPGSEAAFIAGASVGVPMQRIAKPEEIANAVFFIADHNAASYITGANLPIDGGHVASPLLKAQSSK